MNSMRGTSESRREMDLCPVSNSPSLAVLILALSWGKGGVTGGDVYESDH